ncbi:hypothetical protein D3C86_1117020 [compost metagenome]
MRLRFLFASALSPEEATGCDLRSGVTGKVIFPMILGPESFTERALITSVSSGFSTFGSSGVTFGATTGSGALTAGASATGFGCSSALGVSTGLTGSGFISATGCSTGFSTSLTGSGAFSTGAAGATGATGVSALGSGAGASSFLTGRVLVFKSSRLIFPIIFTPGKEPSSAFSSTFSAAGASSLGFSTGGV